jgi:type I restriction-modification system DNA methylase subunit
VSDWGGDRLREDARWTYGTPPISNANYAWLQHIAWHLAPNGTAGVVLANGSMSSEQSGENTIRKAMVEADVVDCMVALPGQLFYSTQIPACLWFLCRLPEPKCIEAALVFRLMNRVSTLDALARSDARTRKDILAVLKSLKTVFNTSDKAHNRKDQKTPSSETAGQIARQRHNDSGSDEIRGEYPSDLV